MLFNWQIFPRPDALHRQVTCQVGGSRPRNSAPRRLCVPLATWSVSSPRQSRVLLKREATPLHRAPQDQKPSCWLCSPCRRPCDPSSLLLPHRPPSRLSLPRSTTGTDVRRGLLSKPPGVFGVRVAVSRVAAGHRPNRNCPYLPVYQPTQAVLAFAPMNPGMNRGRMGLLRSPISAGDQRGERCSAPVMRRERGVEV